MTSRKLRRSYQRLRSALENMTVLLLLNQVAVAGVAFVINLFSTQALSPASRGEMAFYLQLAFVLQTLAMFGTDKSFILGFPRSQKKAVTKSFIRLNIPGIVLFSSLTLVAAGLAVSFHDHSIYGFLSLTFLFVSTGIFGVSIRIAFIVNKGDSTRNFLVSTAAVQIVLLLSSFGLFVSGIDEVFLWVSIYPAAGLVYLLFSFRLIRKSKAPLVDLEVRKLLVKEGWKLYPLNLATFVLQKADRLLLPFLASSSELGRYVFVISILELASWPVIQWIDTQIGRWREQFRRQEYQRLSGIVTLPVIGSALLAGLVSVFTYCYIVFFLGPDYQNATALIIPLAVAIVLKTYSRIFAALLVAQDRVRLTTLIEVISLVISVSLFVLLMPLLGAIGASLGLLISSLFSLIIRFVFVRRSN